MSVTEFPDLSLAREEAATWIAKLDRGLDATERADLRHWCMTSPANARALRQLSDMWGSLDVIRAVTEVLPDRNYRVLLDNGHEILAYAAGKMSKYKIRVLEGDRVSVVLSPYDLTRGRVIYRHK